VAVEIPEEMADALPPLIITLDSDVVLTYSSKEYLGYYYPTPEEYTSPTGNPDPVLRYLKIVEGDDMVLGQAALSKFYLEIDRANKMMAIAPSTPGCLPPSLPPP